MGGRRQFLGFIIAATLSGCSTSESPTTTERTTTDQGCTTPESSPLPSAEVPSEQTRESAERVAVSIEETYGRERAESEGWTVDGTDWTETSVQDFANGHFAKATVSIDAHRSYSSGTGTEETEYGSLLYKGWYRITSEKIERAPATGGGPPETGWTTVTCA